MQVYRWTGPYAPVYWAMVTCNVLIPQVLWSRRVRRHAGALFVLSLVINLGMWMERVMIVVSSLSRDYTPSAWRIYLPTGWDWVLCAVLATLSLVDFAVRHADPARLQPADPLRPPVIEQTNAPPARGISWCPTPRWPPRSRPRSHRCGSRP